MAASYPIGVATIGKHLRHGWTARGTDKCISLSRVSPEFHQMSQKMPLPFGSAKHMAGVVKRDHLSWGWSEPITQHRSAPSSAVQYDRANTRSSIPFSAYLAKIKCSICSYQFDR